MLYQPELNLKPEEVIVYLRKSRSDDPLLTVEEVLANHEKILDEWAEKNLGAKVPEGNKYREVVSGETIEDRPEIKEVLRRIESPKIKAVLIVEVQRLSRGDLEDAGRLIKLLRYTNTLVITTSRNYDIRDEYDRDSFERELKRGNEFLEYQKKILNRGRILSVQQGNYLGSVAPYGYDKIMITEGKKKCPTLEINPAEADIVRMVFDMYVNKNIGVVNIAHKLNKLGVKTKKGKLWSQENVKIMLGNEHYIGKVRWNWRKTINIVEDGEINKTRPRAEIGEYLVYDGRHEAIISDELFEAARAKRGRNHRARAKTKFRNPFAGLIQCQCGRSMSMRAFEASGAAPRILCDNSVYCKTSSCLFSDIVDRVIAILEECISDFEMRIKNNNGDSAKLHANLIKRLEAKRDELDKKEIAQWEAQADPDPTKRMPDHVFKILNEKLLKEKEEVRQALCAAYESMPEPVDYTEKILRFQDALDALKNPEADPETQNKLLKACIDKIVYKREKSVRITAEMAGGRGVLPRGGTWVNAEIELDVKLRL